MDLQGGYDVVASAYVERFADELSAKPFDTKMLDWLAERVASTGPICDMGCGPGQVAAYLRGLGRNVCGIDLSSEMVRHAALANPDVAFEQGDMRDLTGVTDAAYGGLVAFYSIVNLPHNEHPQVFAELSRVLRPGGWMLVSFHVGQETRHVEEFLGRQVSLDFHFFEPSIVRQHLTEAGLDVTEVIEREPYDKSVEAQTKRAYLFSHKS